MTVPELETLLEEAFPRHLSRLQTLPGASEVITALAARKMSICVVTNTPASLAREILAAAGLKCRKLVGGTDVPHPKPAPDMLLEACRKLGVEPAEVVMIGDSAYDREAAHAAGSRFIGFRCEGDARIDSLAELPLALEAL